MDNTISSVRADDQSYEDIVEQIVAATKEQHARLDERTTGFLTGGTLTLDKYRRLLEAYYGFYKPLDQVYEHLEQLEGWQEVQFSLMERKKSHWLEKDLCVLGASQETINTLPLFQGQEYHITSVAQALGLLYVIEGSTLGGQYLAHIVEQSLSLDRNTGCAFLRSYGPQEARTMWRVFCQQLSAYAHRHPEDTRHIIDSTVAVYSVAERWLAVPESDLA